MPAHGKAMKRLLRRLWKDERGVTLIELVLVLTIIGIITIVAYQNFGGADSAARGNRFIQETQVMASRARQAYRSRPNFGTGNATSAMCERNVIAAQFCDASGVATDGNGGAITFTMSTTSFTLNRTDVPQAVCQEALTEFNTGATTAPASISVNGGTALIPKTIDVTAAAAACSSDNNMIAFVYDKR